MARGEQVVGSGLSDRRCAGDHRHGAAAGAVAAQQPGRPDWYPLLPHNYFAGPDTEGVPLPLQQAYQRQRAATRGPDSRKAQH